MATGQLINATVQYEDAGTSGGVTPFLVAIAEGGTGATTAATARANLHALDEAFAPIWISGTISSLPATFSDSRIPADTTTTETHCFGIELGTPSAVTSDLTFTTTQGNVVISGTLASGGSTTVKFAVGQFLKQESA